MTVTLLVYDLDGTLVDSAQNIANAVNRARIHNGLPELTLAQVVPCIGEGSVRLIEGALFGMVSVPLDDEPVMLNPEQVAFEPVYEAFIADYRNTPADGLVYYDGVLEALEWWQKRGVPQAILTNKPHEVTVNLIEKLGIGHYFTHVIGPGADLYGQPVQPKPDTRALEAIIAETGVDRSGVWMIGDGVPDVRVAQIAGIGSLAILGGLYPPNHVLSLEPPPMVVCETFKEAAEYLKELVC